jgi:hypothetical protein
MFQIMFEASKFMEERESIDFSQCLSERPSRHIVQSVEMLSHQRPSEVYAHLVFCWVLGFDFANRSILECEDLLVDLVGRALIEAKNLEVPKPERYQMPVERLYSIFDDGIILQPWEPFAFYADDNGSMGMLEICADIIDMTDKGGNIDTEEKLADLLQQVEDVLSSVTNTELDDDDIKNFLIARLEEISIAIRRYKVGGPAYLRKVVESNLGAILLKATASHTLQQSSVELMKRVLTVVIAVGGLVDLGANVENYILPKSTEVIELLLPSSESKAPEEQPAQNHQRE